MVIAQNLEERWSFYTLMKFFAILTAHDLWLLEFKIILSSQENLWEKF